MSKRSMRAIGVIGAAVACALTIAAACARDGSAQVADARSSAQHAAEDTASVAWLLRAVRGSDPLLCELAVRNVDMHGSWSNWGPLGDNPLDADTNASALIHWIQRDHNDPVVVPRLVAALHDPDGCVRRVAGSLLGRVNHPSARTALVSAIDDASADTRYVAALGLGLGEVTEAQGALTRKLRDESPRVRRAAAWALGALEQASAVPVLIEVLQKDTDPQVRQAAAWAIGRAHNN